MKYLPYAFTEQGVAMLSSVLRSERAAEVDIAIMRPRRASGTSCCRMMLLAVATMMVLAPHSTGGGGADFEPAGGASGVDRLAGAR